MASDIRIFISLDYSCFFGRFMTEHGFSKTYMGFIVGSSSIFGALFDIAAIKILPSMQYRRVFMMMFAVCLIYPFVLFGAKTISIYILAMALWGIYYDLKNFGLFDFIAQNTSHEHLNKIAAYANSVRPTKDKLTFFFSSFFF